MELARNEGGVLINADAMQVYRELKILTARPSTENEAAVPHRLYGHVSAAEPYSAGRWLADAAAALSEAWRENRLPIVVGGTGLYFRALERGLAPVPPVPEEVRQRWRRALAERGAAALHAELAARAPQEASGLRPSDGQRIARALEVLEATGKPLSPFKAEDIEPGPLAGADLDRRLIVPDRAELYRRADERFLRMIAKGALDEVRKLLAMRLDPALPAMKAIGVEPLSRHLAGELSLDQAIALAQRQTRNYAKRQMTWLRHQMQDWTVVGP
jgi:tRNA dimethylallyltransferase